MENHGFVDRLEALRGLAALSVAVGHSMIWLSFGTQQTIWANSLQNTEGSQAAIARAILSVANGGVAVDLFFVLSGFVLARSLSSFDLSPGAYLAYGVKRVFRLMPALWLSLAIVVAYLGVPFHGFSSEPLGSMWFNWWYRTTLTARDFFENALLLSATLNSNAWTLKVEMIASFLLPVIVFILGRNGILRSAFVLLSTYGFAILMHGSGMVLANYMYMFVVGAILAKHLDADSTTTHKDLVVAGSLTLIVGTAALLPLDHTLLMDSLFVMGSVGLIWSASIKGESRLLAILDVDAVKFIGRVSYSFYLLHFSVLYGVARWVLRNVDPHYVSQQPLTVVCSAAVVSILIALPLAWGSYRFVERPLTKLGRNIASVGSPLKVRPQR